MTSIYDETAADALADIKDAGAPVVFLADTWRGGTIASDVTGYAVEVPGDPDTYQALTLIQRNPVTLVVAASGLGIALAPGQSFVWGTKTYGVQLATPVAPDATPILWTIVGAT